MLGPSDGCVWGCGRTNFNVEHVIGRGFANRLDLPYPLVIRWSEYGRVEGTLQVVVNDRVCEGCNGGFMRRLDERMRTIMGASITDKAPVDLTEDQQTRVARWAFKVAVMLMLWVHDQREQHPELLRAAHEADPDGRLGEPYVPLDDLAYFGKRQLPPEHVRIWIGAATEVMPDIFQSVSALSRPVDPAPERLGYYVVFALRHLVVYVLAGTTDHGDVLRQALGRFVDPAHFAPEVLVPVWPTTEKRRHWPPARELTKAGLEGFTGASFAWDEAEPPAKLESNGA